MKLFVVLEDDRVVYQADTLMEGIAFIAGRRAGVLCGVLSEKLSKPNVEPDRQVNRKPRLSRRKIA